MQREKLLLDPEEWRDIEGYEGYYQVSNWGRVRSLPRYRRNRVGTAAVPGWVGYGSYEKGTGYYVTALWKDNKSKIIRVHVLVCLAFHGPKPSSKHEVAHNDGNRQNNYYKNLRWATRKENDADRLLHGTDNRGDKSRTVVITKEQAKLVKELRIKTRWSAVKISEHLNIKFSIVDNIVHGSSWQWLEPDCGHISKWRKGQNK